MRATILAANEELLRARAADQSSTWTAGLTCLSDKTDEEVEATMSGRLAVPPKDVRDASTARAERELLAPLRRLRGSLPASVDLTTIGRVSPVKSQGK